MKQIRLKDCTYIIKEGMKRVVSVILMREDVRCKNKTLNSLLCAIIVNIWWFSIVLLALSILFIYQLFV